MKKTINILMLCAALCLLAACGGEAKKNEAPAAVADTTAVAADTLQKPNPVAQPVDEEPSVVVEEEEAVDPATDDAPPTEG